MLQSGLDGGYLEPDGSRAWNRSRRLRKDRRKPRLRHESGVGIARVIEGGFCVGCGVCAAADAGSFRI